MISFNEFLKIKKECLFEGVREDEEKRKQEAEIRKKASKDHYDLKKQLPSLKPPYTQDKIDAYIKAKKQLNIGDSPVEKFRDDVSSIVCKKLFKDDIPYSFNNLCYKLYGIKPEPIWKTETDRITNLVDDCFDDGTSVEETARMTLDLITSMGYKPE